MVRWSLSVISPLLFQFIVKCSLADNSHCKPNALKIPTAVTHRPLKQVIAHRGASAYLPEHSIGSYRLALELGADWIEPDIVATKDGELIALHTVDLNITTNVAEVFPERTWFSPYGNRTSYWTFNFTLQEIRSLTVRQRLPDARVTFFDEMFPVPTLNEILDTLINWNEVDLPQRLDIAEVNDTSNEEIGNYPNQLNLRQSGLYLELKDAGWLQSEAGLDLVDLLYTHMDHETEKWTHILQCWDEVLFNQYVVPGLVVQSFDGVVLKSFHDKWNEKTAAMNISAAEPSYVLLATLSICRKPNFWLDVSRNYRGFIQGLGLDKHCLLDRDMGTAAGQDVDPAAKAEEMGIILHPWTERPEITDVDPRFDSVEEELDFLLCRVHGVHAVFTESVSKAVTQIQLGCSDVKNPAQPTPAPVEPNHPGSNSECTQEKRGDVSSSAGFSTGAVLGSFVGGLLVAIGVTWGMKRRHESHRRSVVPTSDNGRYVGYDLEMT